MPFIIDDIDAIKDLQTRDYWANIIKNIMYQEQKPIAIIGACRTGKSYLLEKLTSCVISSKEAFFRNNHRIIQSALPDMSASQYDLYALDDTELCHPLTLAQFIINSANYQKPFYITFQSQNSKQYDLFESLLLNEIYYVLFIGNHFAC